MRTKLKAGWIQHNIGKTNKLYRKYKTFYNKIGNINKVFYTHRIAGIPMHPETEKLCKAKVNNYLVQMDSLWYAMIYDEVAPENFTRHYMPSYIPLGTWLSSAHVGFYRESKSKILEDRKIFQEKREERKKLEESKNKAQNSLFGKLKSLFSGS